MNEQLMCDYGNPQSVCGHFQLSKSTFGERFKFRCKQQMKITVCRLAFAHEGIRTNDDTHARSFETRWDCGLWDTLASAW